MIKKACRTKIAIVLFLFSWLLGTQTAEAQNKVDSLRTELNNMLSDSTRTYVLLALAYEYNNLDPQKTLEFANQALTISQKSGDEYAQAGAYNQLGSAQQLLGNFTSANSYIAKAEEIYIKLKKQKELGDTYTYYGNVAWGQGNHNKALEYCLKALAIREKINDKIGQALSINNIGVLYRVLNDYDRSLAYLERALKIRQSINDESGTATSLNNIGGVYEKQNKIELAIAYQNKALTIHQKLGDKRNEAVTYHYLGMIYEKQNELNEALQYHFKALSIRQELNDPTFVVTSYNRLAKVFIKQKAFVKAQYYLDLAISTAQKIGAKDRYTECLNSYHELYEAKGDFKTAMEYFKRYIAARDSVFSLEKKRMVEELNAQFSSDAKDRKIMTLKNKQMLNESELENKNLTLILVVIVLLSVAVVAFMTFRKSKERARINLQLQKQSQLIASKNELLEQQQKQILEINEGLKNKNDQIEQQSKELQEIHAETLAQRDNIAQKNEQLAEVLAIVESKSTKIESSIRYALRIQTAMLPSREQLKETIPQHFIFFKPKDIVSGDFYWLHKTATYTFIAVVDCTGHGVPGALMSLVGDAYLNLLIVQKGMTSPADILIALDACVHKALKHNEKQSTNRDGMDISLARVNTQERSICFAGAHQPLYVVQKSQLKIFKGSPCGVAGNDTSEKTFAEHHISCSEPTICYMSTDGFQDQFGGSENKKFGRQRLAALIQSAASLDLEDQQKLFEDTFDSWKQNSNQIDDVLCLGFWV